MSGLKDHRGMVLEVPHHFSTGDPLSPSSGKQIKNKDFRAKGNKQFEKRSTTLAQQSSSHCTSPRSGKYSKSTYSGGRRPSNQRPQLSQRRDFDDVTYIEKELTVGERKKSGSISLNHLLNFTITPRERYSSGHNGSSSSGDFSHRRGKKHHDFNKEQFLQANCQFVVREGGGDYSVYCSDPDLLVDWECIEQVRLFCHEIPSCPICLYAPSAAKITRCGHVYCSSCILHYLTLSDKKWRKCPICYESIYKKDLKSVTTLASKLYDDKDVITMKLMVRCKDATFALPKTDWSEETASLIPPLNDGEHCHFAKLLSASPAQIKTDIIDKERTLLLQQLAQLTPDEESERCFIETALEDLKTREDNMQQSETLKQGDEVTETPSEDQVSPSSNDKVLSVHDDSYISGEFQPTFSEDEDESVVKSKPKDSDPSLLSVDVPVYRRHINCLSSSSSEGEIEENESVISVSGSPQYTSEYVHFYQSSDGQHLYLHPINTKCLLKEYGSWDNCPSTITARIVEIEHYSMTEDERKRHRFLGHLPLTCEFGLCELDLKPPDISYQTLEDFAGQLQKRKQKRQKKRREEKRREKKADRQDYLSVDSISLPPNPADISPERLHNFLSMASSPPLPSPLRPLNPNAKSFVPDKTPVKDDGTRKRMSDTVSPLGSTGPSFAQALVSGEKKTPISKTPPNIRSTGLVKSPPVLPGDDKEDESYTVPSFQDAFSDAFHTASLSVKAATQNPGGKPGGSKTAKKGCKKLVLFSTGGQRRI